MSVTEEDIFITLTQEKFEIDLALGGSERIDQEIDFDLGLDGLPLGIEADGGVDFGWEWGVDFGLGLSRDEGFYFIVNEDDTPEVRLDLDVGLLVDDAGTVPIPTSFGVDLFGLELTATDNLNEAGDDGLTGISGMLSLDVSAINDDGRLTIQEIDDNSFGDIFTAGIDAEAVVDLGLAVDISAALPSIEADLVVGFGVMFGTNDSSQFSNNAVQFVEPTLALNDITLNLGDVISNVIKPILDDVNEYIEPIKPLIEFLGTEVPGISQLSQASGDGTVTVLDLAFIEKPAQGQAAKKFIGVVNQLIEFIDVVNDLDEGDNIALNFGSISFGNEVDLTQPGAFDNVDPTAGQDEAVTEFDEVQSQIDGSDQSKLASAFGQLTRESDAEGEGGLGLELSLIKDPSNIFKLLLGQTADIVFWDIPTFELGFTFEANFFPIPIVPVKVTVGADFDFFADLSVGLDTRGLQTGFFLDGFFFGDLDSDGEDIAEFGVGIGARLRAALDLLVASAGIEGELRADIFANWNDQDDDGKLYGDELANIIQRDGIECIFNLTGELRAIVRLVWEVFGAEGSKEFINALLFSFENECPKYELGHLAEDGEVLSDGTEAAPGTLIIHAGPYAGMRQNGVSSDVAEDLTITRLAPGVIQIDGMGLRDRYSGVTSIYFDGGQGDDRVELIDNPEIGQAMLPSVLIGGVGDDELLGSTGIDDIRGGTGNDTIMAFDEDDIIAGGAGMDTINAGLGSDTIDGGDGPDAITADEDDFAPGGGDDIIMGGEGVDIILAGSGNDTIFGGAGGDIISGSDGIDTISGDAGDDMITAGIDGDIVSGGSGNDTIIGGEGNDELSGDGGNDYIEGNLGDDTMMGGLGSDALIGNFGSDTILGGWGNDVILANDDSGPESASVTHYIEGGPDDDFICGDDGFDEIFGGTAVLGFDDVIANPARFPSANGYTVTTCSELPVLEAAQPVSIQGQKFDDANQNGVRDENETGINGWTIELYDEEGNLVDREITADVDLNDDGVIDPVTESGIYIFDAQPGVYSVREVADPMWIQRLRWRCFDS